MTQLTGARLAHFTARVIQDAMAEATAEYWTRRGQAFLDAQPKPGDFTGRATPAMLAEQAERCRQSAQACFNRASIETPGQPVDVDVYRALAEHVGGQS